MKCQGANGILNEVDEARRVVEALADELRDSDVDVVTFHDDTSTSQNENLNTIVDFHNAHLRDLDISVHFNAYTETTSPMGVEVLWITQATLAEHVAAAIASVGFINRGAKKRTDLYFLNQTQMPSILIEVCFVDSSADAELYRARFGEIVTAIAAVLTGEYQVAQANG
jgi:N-acetylmuramoyl-L-alanine amidase